MNTDGLTLEDADQRRFLFLSCFIALIATAFAFIVRAMLISTWGDEFNLTNTQQGEIFGVGLWPFAISIVLFSLIIDRIGYGRALFFAFLCHVSSVILTITANGYWDLWIATFIVAIGNGTVEAVINPVVATMYKKDKTKWLNILHAGWPGGMVLGGLLAMYVGQTDGAGLYDNWKLMVGLLLVPTFIYGAMLFRCRFPVQERVAAGVSHRDMLAEIGEIGIFIIAGLVCQEICRVFGWPAYAGWVLALFAASCFGIHTKSLGKPLFIVLLIIMGFLATTELGIDSWVTPLMEGEVKEPITVLLYTSAIMMVLRFLAGPIVHRLSPLGLLAVCSALAAAGLWLLSGASGVAMIFFAATIYAVGKTFFWPTMLGVVSERFPRGGAMTINGIAAVGMLSVGIVGSVFLGRIQDTETVKGLRAEQPQLVAAVVTEKSSVLGSYEAVDPDAAKYLEQEDQDAIKALGKKSQKAALSTAALFPVVMLISYLLLILYFRSQGGYKPVDIDEKQS